MAIKPFFLLLTLIVALPLLLSFVSFEGYLPEVSVLGVLLLLSLFIHIRGGFRFLKPLLVAAVFLLTLFVWIKDFSLEKLPLNLFFTAYAFSVFLLLKDRTK